MTLTRFVTGFARDDMHGVERVLLAYMPIEAEGDAYPNRGAARPLRKECFLRKTLTPPSCSIVGQFQPTMPLTTGAGLRRMMAYLRPVLWLSIV